VIIDDEAEPEEDAPFGLSYKSGGTPCKHLKVIDGVAECSIHDDPRYEDTPCHDFTQVGAPDDPCRMGQGIRNGIVQIEIPEIH